LQSSYEIGSGNSYLLNIEVRKLSISCCLSMKLSQ
jgi:hypothetical protein